MDGIFFLVLAFLTIGASIKLSNYGDILSNQSKVGSLFIGGILIAAITSLPEFITSISASLIDNPSLSFGDILGSNFFNIFALSTLNIIFFNKKVFKNIKKIYVLECIILFIDYMIIYFGCRGKIISFTSIILILLYFVYIISIFKRNKFSNEAIKEKTNYILLKFILTTFVMAFLSILLTLEADKISRIYPNFSSSTIGAVLLGITTSLPEVVTTFELFRLNNYNMAISNILGSNIFNFLVLAISDFFFKNGYIYSSIDKESILYLFGGLLSTLLLSLGILKNKKNSFFNLIFIIIIISYLLVWYLQFS